MFIKNKLGKIKVPYISNCLFNQVKILDFMNF